MHCYGGYLAGMVGVLSWWACCCVNAFTPDRTKVREEDEGASTVVPLKERCQHQCVVMVVTVLGWSACAIAGLLLWRARPVAMVAALLSWRERCYGGHVAGILGVLLWRARPVATVATLRSWRERCYDGRPDARASQRVATTTDFLPDRVEGRAVNSASEHKLRRLSGTKGEDKLLVSLQRHRRRCHFYSSSVALATLSGPCHTLHATDESREAVQRRGHQKLQLRQERNPAQHPVHRSHHDAYPNKAM